MWRSYLISSLNFCSWKFRNTVLLELNGPIQLQSYKEQDKLETLSDINMSLHTGSGAKSQEKICEHSIQGKTDSPTWHIISLIPLPYLTLGFNTGATLVFFSLNFKLLFPLFLPFTSMHIGSCLMLVSLKENSTLNLWHHLKHLCSNSIGLFFVLQTSFFPSSTNYFKLSCWVVKSKK